jgi:hypothetical protein
MLKSVRQIETNLLRILLQSLAGSTSGCATCPLFTGLVRG